MIGIADAAVSSGSGESEKSWRNYNGATAGRGQISPVSELQIHIERYVKNKSLQQISLATLSPLNPRNLVLKRLPSKKEGGV